MVKSFTVLLILALANAPAWGVTQGVREGSVTRGYLDIESTRRARVRGPDGVVLGWTDQRGTYCADGRKVAQTPVPGLLFGDICKLGGRR